MGPEGEAAAGSSASQLRYSADVIVVDSESEPEALQAPATPLDLLGFADDPPSPDEDPPSAAEEPPGLISDSEDEAISDDELVLTSDSDGEVAVKISGDDPADFGLINRTSAIGQFWSRRRCDRPVLEQTSVRPVPAAISSGRELIDPTTPDIGMTHEETQTLLKFRPPKALLLILAIMFCSPCYSNNVCLDFVEYFSGQQAVTNGIASLGLYAVPYDVINDGRYQDLNSIWGFIHALQLLRMLEPVTGLIWLGTVCSTWVFMSRNSTMRTPRNPRGDLRRRCVLKGNRQAARSAALIAFCFARRMGFVLEQPGSSILWLHPAMAHVERVAREALGGRWHRICTYMACFSANHIKRTELCSNESWIHHLSRSHPGRVASTGQPAAVSRKRKDGKVQCSGTAALKATQTYTEAFGVATSEAVSSFRRFYDDVKCTRGQQELGADSDDSDDSDDGGPWEDLELSQIVQALQAMHPTSSVIACDPYGS